MIVNKNIVLLLFFSIILNFSCTIGNKKTNSKDDDIFEVLSVVIDTMSNPSSPPIYPPPLPKKYEDKRLTYQDSVDYRNDVITYINRQKIIAIDSTFYTSILSKITKEMSLSDLVNQCSDFHTKSTINLNYIDIAKEDSIVYFNKKTMEKSYGSGTYIGVDCRIIISKVILNTKNNKAVIKASLKYEKLESYSATFYLEKKKGLWGIIKRI
ncbi:hypothetical protein [Galbibacter sp.]|jgi:hypothetical protein|uniref:hypothetical protein n=1 Tax=Galbibacter sp. TaxID=2918471 RepID=UPI003A8F2D40